VQYGNHEDTKNTKVHEEELSEVFFVRLRALRVFVVAV